MALTLGDNFSYQGAKPLDTRLVYSTVASMKAVVDSTMYDGCLAYCTATDKTYQWKSTNAVDETTGKWREFTSGGDTIQVSSMPTASASELGKVYQYIGSTTLVYTHGYFYECVSDGESTPTYSWEVCDVVDTLSASDVTDVKNAFAVQTYVDRGIVIDDRGTEFKAGTYIDAQGNESIIYGRVLVSATSRTVSDTSVTDDLATNLITSWKIAEVLKIRGTIYTDSGMVAPVPYTFTNQSDVENSVDAYYTTSVSNGAIKLRYYRKSGTITITKVRLVILYTKTV